MRGTARSVGTGSWRSGSSRWAATAPKAKPGRICASLGLPERVLTQQLRTLSGGQRRRVELARILFAASEGGAGASGSGTTLLLDEPTNHLDADSVGWLRDFLRAHTRRVWW